MISEFIFSMTVMNPLDKQVPFLKPVQYRQSGLRVKQGLCGGGVDGLRHGSDHQKLFDIIGQSVVDFLGK